jgi:hypothetical protein
MLEADHQRARCGLALGIAILCLAACEGRAPADDQVRQAEPTLVGADRDEHGCIGSAGYTWCARTNQCERTWELAKVRGLGDGAEAVVRFCAAAP